MSWNGFRLVCEMSVQLTIQELVMGVQDSYIHTQASFLLRMMVQDSYIHPPSFPGQASYIGGSIGGNEGIG